MSDYKLYYIAAGDDQHIKGGLLYRTYAVLYVLEYIRFFLPQEEYVVPIGKCNKHKEISYKHKQWYMHAQLISFQLLI